MTNNNSGYTLSLEKHSDGTGNTAVAFAARGSGPTSQKGSTIAIVLGVATIMLILALSYSSLVQRQAQLVNIQTVGEISNAIGETCAELASQLLKETLRNIEGDLFKALTKPGAVDQYGPADLTLDTASGSLALYMVFKPVIDELTKPYGGFSPGNGSDDLKAQASFFPNHFKSFPPGNLEKSSGREKHGIIIVTVNTTFRGIERKVTTWHEIRILSARPPVLRKFTFFIGNALDGGDGDRFNIIKSDRTGLPVGGGYPITLFNGEAHRNWAEEFQVDREEKFKDIMYNRQGWVYLGGSGPIYLNLTFGTDYQVYSEDFLFFNRGLSDGGRAYRNPTVESDPAFTILSQDFQVNNWDMGFYTFDDSERNETSLLTKIPPTSRYTNCFHLYGKSNGEETEPSPTLVLGQVHGRYLQITAARLKKASECKLLSGAAYQDYYDLARIFPLPYFDKNESVTIPLIKQRVDLASPGNAIYQETITRLLEPTADDGSGSPAPGWWTDYTETKFRQIMSQPMQRAYNESADIIREGNTQPSVVFNTFDSQYRSRELDSTSHEVPRNPAFRNPFNSALTTFHQFFETYFSGDAAQLEFIGGKPDPKAQFNPKFCRVFTNTTDFKKELEDRGMLFKDSATGIDQLKLGSSIFVEGSIELGNLQLMNSGIIVTTGDIRLTGDIVDEGTQGRPCLLTLCSLKGNIVFKGAKNVTACLVAYHEVKTDGASNINIEGGVSMRRISSSTLGNWIRAGGDISYNPMLSVDEDEADFVKCLFADVSPYPTYVEF